MWKARMHEAKEGQNPSTASKVRSGLSPSALQPYKGSRTHDYWSLRENGLVWGGGVGVKKGGLREWFGGFGHRHWCL